MNRNLTCLSLVTALTGGAIIAGCSLSPVTKHTVPGAPIVANGVTNPGPDVVSYTVNTNQLAIDCTGIETAGTLVLDLLVQFVPASIPILQQIVNDDKIATGQASPSGILGQLKLGNLTVAQGASVTNLCNAVSALEAKVLPGLEKNAFVYASAQINGAIIAAAQSALETVTTPRPAVKLPPAPAAAGQVNILKSILAAVLGWLAARIKGKAMGTTITVPSATTDVGAVAGAVTELAKAEEQIRAEENTPAMVAAKTARNEQAAVDKTNKAVAAKDTKEIEREIAE